MDKQTTTDIKFEIKSRKLVLKRLESVVSRANEKARAVRAARLARLDELSEYKSLREAQDAYGWDLITEEEYAQLQRFFEEKEELKDSPSPEEYAAEILGRFVAGLRREIASFEFDLLPPKEQERIRKNNEELLQRRHRRTQP